MPLFTYFFLGWVGLGVGEFVGFITIFICFPIQHCLVYRKQSIVQHNWDTMVGVGKSNDAMVDIAKPNDTMVDIVKPKRCNGC